MSLSWQWSCGVPDVLTNIDTDMDTVNEEDWRFRPRLEIAILIKDAVVWQVVFVVHSC